MKKISLLTIVFLLTGCFKTPIDSSTKNMYDDGMENLYKFYERHSRYNMVGCATKKKFEKMYEYNFTINNYEYESVIYGVTTKGVVEPIIIHCIQEENATQIQNALNWYSFAATNVDQYLIKDNYVYYDGQFSYLFLIGEPLEKDGFLYYELENGETMLFGDVCNCEDEEKNTSYETIIPDWVDIIGGGHLNSYYSWHYPEAKKLIIPDSVKEIKINAFAYSMYEEISLSKKLKRIATMAFVNCENLKSVIIPESVEYIGYHAFTSGTLYCEASSKPEGWNKYFAGKDVKIYYSDQWEYDENGNPKKK